MPFTYGELQAEMDMINRAYIEVMTTGDAKGRVFTFPIPTYNITRDFPWESENAQLLFEMTAKYGLPYFQNFVNSELEPNMVRSMCCRLQLDLRELLKRGNGLFGSAEQTGSVGVVTVNCARLGHLHRGRRGRPAARARRAAGTGQAEPGDQAQADPAPDGPGPVPLHQALPRHAAQPLLDAGRQRPQRDGAQLQRRRRRHHHRTRPRPGAAAAGPCARAHRRVPGGDRPPVQPGGHAGRGHDLPLRAEDRKRWPDILQAGTAEQPYYTNSSQLPVGFTDDPFEALERQEALQSKYTGGTVLHLYMGERLSSGAACRELVRRALTRFRLPYITVTPTFSICPTHGYLAGEHPFCPKCDEALLERKRHAIAAQPPAANPLAEETTP